MMYWSLSFTHNGSSFSACKIWGKWPNKLSFTAEIFRANFRCLNALIPFNLMMTENQIP